MDYKNIILNKYSVRDYKEKKVDAKNFRSMQTPVRNWSMISRWIFASWTMMWFTVSLTVLPVIMAF